jgi:predicted transcriptional regulator
LRDPFVGVRFPADLLARLDREAEQGEQTRSALIRESVSNELARRIEQAPTTANQRTAERAP